MWAGFMRMSESSTSSTKRRQRALPSSLSSAPSNTRSGNAAPPAVLPSSGWASETNSANRFWTVRCRGRKSTNTKKAASPTANTPKTIIVKADVQKLSLNARWYEVKPGGGSVGVA